MPTVHAFDYLADPTNDAPPVCVIFGNEPFFKTLALKQLRSAVLGEEDVPFATFQGETAEMRDVLDELSTVALFGGGGKRLAVIEGADKFVTLHRPRLEDYVAKPKSGGVLVLVVDLWPSNTKLYKAVDKSGLAIECKAPEKKKDVPDESRICKWLSSWAKSAHQITLPAEPARLMLELVGPEFGILDQELAKVALFAGIGGKVTVEQVRDVVGGWRINSAWELADTIAEGNAALALQQLDKILQSGEKPIALYGQLAWALRRYAMATRIYEEAERQGRKPLLAEAIKASGFRHWEKGKVEEAERQIKQLTRERAGKLYRWLLDIDLALKGSHSNDHRGRWALEQLIFRLSREFAPVRRR
jgi:DNA polymerase-3 subunit delta